VTTLQGQALAQPEEIPRWEVALAAAEQADPAGDPKTKAQIVALERAIRAGLDAARRDKVLLDRLVEIRSAVGDDPDGTITDHDYAEAFREAGIDFARLPPADAGARIKARPASVALALAGSLDYWAAIRRGRRANASGAARLWEAVNIADPDPWRVKLRAARDQSDEAARRAALQALAKEANYDELGPISLFLLAIGLNYSADRNLAESVLRKAQQRYPRDVWINYELGKMLEGRSRRDEAIRFYTAARSIRPETAHELAHALQRRGDSDEAIAVFRDLARLRPGNARDLTCLGLALKDKGLFREAAETLEAAVAAGREASRLKPGYSEAHNVGIALTNQGKLDEAIAEYRESIRLKPDDAVAHYNLGTALNNQGRRDEAGAPFRQAIRLRPDYAEAYCNLADVLKGQGDYAGALEMFRKGHELGSRESGWRYLSAQWVAEAERNLALSNRLPAILRGEAKPGDNAERLVFARMAFDRKSFAGAARLWGEAMESDPRLGDDRQAGHRYNAACAATLAATGQGKDIPPPDDATRSNLREQALGWLKAERAAWNKLLESGPPQARPAIAQTLRQWKHDGDLAGIRDAAALDRLPEAERKQWQAFWADVEALLKRSPGQTP
jgi:tetratricopeptide (TPR) repeat protein